MEAVPKLPMISFGLKVSPVNQPTDFGKLKQYIRDFYHEDPESYTGEIRKIEALRAAAVSPASDSNGCSILKKYYSQLHFLQSRFPMGNDGAAAVNFIWKDIYSNMLYTMADIRFELESVLHNIGALHSQLGANDTRTTSDGLRLACSHFQCAAWAFQHLKDTYPQPSGVEFAPDLMQFMYQICLAQAQECILEKSMTDNRKASINAKVAAQIVYFYKMALNAMSRGALGDDSVQDTVGSKLFKSWKRYIKFKVTYYTSIALLYQGQQSEEQQKMGERLAYYQIAADQLTEAVKLSKGLDHPEVIEEALTFTMDVVEGKKKAAKNENEFIYHEEVPDKDSLPDIKGAALVKGTPFDINDPEISGADIFERLVPMKAHEASSLYSEEKAKLLRRIGAMVDEKDQELVAFMSSLQLDCVNAHTQPDRLPQDVVDRCAALSAKPDAIQNLIGAMDKLSDIYHDVEAMLNEIMELIQKEEVEEREYQEVMGSRPPSIVATDLTREAHKYEEAHNKAAESNNTLHKAMTQHIANLRLLQMPLTELSTKIPALTALHLDQQPVVQEMQHLVTKVEEMRRQRAMLIAQLRESLCSDDITTQLVTRKDENLDTVFQEELQKHVKYVSVIEQNLTAQDNIIKALTDTYAKYAPVRKATMEVIRQRNLTLSALISSYDAYEDLIAKSSKGQEFYRKLETNVTKLLQRVKGTCKVQQEERDTILAKNGKSLHSKSKVIPDQDGAALKNYEQVPPSSAPKLKDYLESYKKDKSGAAHQLQSQTGQVTDPYYNAGNLPSSKITSYSADVVSAPYDNSQPWVPSVRPAPVGQEGTCPTPTSQDFMKESSLGYASYSPNISNKNYVNDGLPYAAEQYASYMAQYQQYPSTSSPYHKPPNYPSPAPSPSLQPQAYKPSATIVPQAYIPPATVASQAYIVPHYNSQSYSIDQAMNQNYAFQPNQGFKPQENYAPIANAIPEMYMTQNIPSVQNHPKNLSSPLHNNVSTNLNPAANAQQPPSCTSTQTYQNHQQPPYTSTQPYQNSYVQPSAQQNSVSTIDQSISNNFTSVKSNQPDISTTYSTQNPLNYTMNPLQENQVDGQKPYIQYQNAANNYTYGAPGVNPAESPVNAVQQQYSTYIPQNYMPYINTGNQYSQGKYLGTQPWQSSYDMKSLPDYYSTSQYPNYSQIGTEKMYTPSAATSQYTHAGQQIGPQTSCSAAQFVSQGGQPNYTQGNYYCLPYGCQYTSSTSQNMTSHMLPVPAQVTTQQAPMTPQSPMTYMQASNSNLKLTFSQDQGATKSNVDLLAGLDFSLSQDPLVPQQKTVETMVKPTATNLEEQLAAMTISEKTAAPSPPVTLTPKHSSENKAEGKLQLKDPFNDPEALNTFVQEVEKFEKLVEGLSIKTLNGPTPLDIKWKELLDLQETDCGKHSISVARCYPVKNRFPDILPYDNSRVELPSTKDDYINASFVKDVTPNFPNCIVTQFPLPSTIGDFWTMVLEQQVELIICLLNNTELEGKPYWPSEKATEMVVGRFKMTLQSCNACKHWVERIIHITDSRVSRVIVHLHFTDWPPSWFPSSPGPFLSLVSEGLSVYSQQRGDGPCVVHCLAGVGRSGLYTLAVAAVCHIHSYRTLPDLISLGVTLCGWRKNILRDREHLKFAFQALLYYSQDLLMKRGILASRSSFEDKKTKSHTRHPSQDFLLGPPKESNSTRQTDDSLSVGEMPADPLSQLDPLWSIRRQD